MHTMKDNGEEPGSIGERLSRRLKTSYSNLTRGKKEPVCYHWQRPEQQGFFKLTCLLLSALFKAELNNN